MPFNGSGVYTPPASDFPAVAGTLIESSKYNGVINDQSTALSACITKDGQTTVTANIPFGGYRLTNVGAATALTDAVRANQVQNSSLTYLTSVSGADTITANAAITPAAYAAGQMFQFVAAGANTGAVTLNVSGLGAKDVTKNGTVALTAGDIPADSVVNVTYDGTRFQLVRNGSVGAGDNTFTGIQRWAKGADIASATSLTLGTDGNYFDVTGTTAITSIGTVGVGTWVKLHFDDALTLTHSATDLILPGGANITTAAGDEAEFVEYASGDWRCVSYVRMPSIPATQAQQEAGTSNAAAVTPAVQQLHPSACKGWIDFDGTGVAAARAAYNATLTDNGTGDYTVTWTVPFSSANYAVQITSPLEVTSGSQAFEVVSKLAGSFRFLTYENGVATDKEFVWVCAFGDQ